MTESKSVALPLGYSPIEMVEGDGFEPSNSERVDLQSTAFSHFATPPSNMISDCFNIIRYFVNFVNQIDKEKIPINRKISNLLVDMKKGRLF